MIDYQQIIQQHSNGSLLVECNDALQKLVKDCIDTGKKGAITVTLAMEPIATKDGGHQMRISPNVTTKNPKYDAGVAYFFVVTDESDQPVGLEKEDPRQTSLFMEAGKEVNAR